MDLKKNIRERCHVNTNDEGDSFVGVKADTEDATVIISFDIQVNTTMMIPLILLNWLFWPLMKEDSGDEAEGGQE